MPDEVKKKTITANDSFDCDTVVPFSIKKQGTTRWYCISEMTGGARDLYLSEIRKVTKITKDAEGKPDVEVSDFKGMSTMLLKHCAFGYDQATKQSDGILVTPETIASWPLSVIDKLVATASEINTLGEDGPEVSGND